jgi:serine/threonine protein kinase
VASHDLARLILNAPRCAECGTLLSGSGIVEGVCAGCLLMLGLPDRDGTNALPGDGRATAGRPRVLEPVGPGVAAPHWAMPAELLRQAARRLAFAAFGVALAFAVSIVLNNLVSALGLYNHAHLAAENVIGGIMVVVSAAMAWTARSGRLTPRRLLLTGLAYEVTVALGISIGDNLEPLPSDLPLVAISWLCVWIVVFPLVVPAPPRWALPAALISASTWPLAYFIGIAAGNPPRPMGLVALNFLENYIAVAFSLFSTMVTQRLQELGCYQLVERLDHGGMGEIWRARHRMLARPVAIKLIRPELLGVRSPAEAAALIGRFKREAEATAALHSPHTVGLHDFGVTPEGVFYYVMDLLEGLDLETLVRRHGPVPPARAIHLLIEACDSLAEAHAQGLIHRDVKPANIVTCRWGLKWDFVKVLDFGLVKATWNPGDDERLTSDGVITGTPAYIAPEAALGGRALDARVDLYGLGCVAYWLLTGERVFAGRTPMELVLHHVKTEPVPPSRRAPWPIPGPLEEIVLSCLAKDPEARPPSAEHLAQRLAECRTAEPWTSATARAWWERNVLGGPVPPRGPSSSSPTR